MIVMIIITLMFQVWSGNIGRPIGHIGQGENYGPVVCVALEATGDHVAAGYHEGFVRLFAVNSGEDLK